MNESDEKQEEENHLVMNLILTHYQGLRLLYKENNEKIS